VLATGLPLDRRLAADAVDFIDQVPGALVGHVHGAAGGRNRAELSNVLQQLDFAGPDAPFRIKVDAYAQRRQRCGGLFLHATTSATDCHARHTANKGVAGPATTKKPPPVLPDESIPPRKNMPLSETQNL